MIPSRRTFMTAMAAAGAALCGRLAQAQAKPLDEKDPQAVALGYVSDTTRADARKFPNHQNSQVCSGCALGQFKTAADPRGNCALFQGRQVANKGWCSAWNKKA